MTRPSPNCNSKRGPERGMISRQMASQPRARCGQVVFFSAAPLFCFILKTMNSVSFARKLLMGFLLKFYGAQSSDFFRGIGGRTPFGHNTSRGSIILKAQFNIISYLWKIKVISITPHLKLLLNYPNNLSFSQGKN